MPLRAQADSDPSNFWDFAIKALSLLIFAGVVACFAIPFRTRLAEYRRVDQDARGREAEKALLERELERRTLALALLERDHGFIEVKARDHLDMRRAGEVIFRFEDSAR